ncbi:MAG TPA: insulinase family protein [Thermoanaerobaculia bacterium]|jgi:zinc protease|nr:insulinase family protein [Thermoanaerobaculia bacterium]
MKRALACLAALLLSSPAAAGRLDGAMVERLDNGLTILLLEDHTLPIVSVQMLYKAGGRNEQTGATGLAHFVEHMAYRATERFPDTDVVSRIYGVGGEWHGYTWIDQTTYFETVPREHLPLVLDIEADRMARLRLPEKELEAERGAVLTELHGYENDPASVLNDAVAAVSFTQHPYRQNVIGWTSDVERITHADVADFYRRYYRPANAVLAIAGDIRPSEALALVRRTFEGIPAGDAAPLPTTTEPPQIGERRVDLPGGGGSAWLQISYRAPAASDPDYPVFLLIQALLTGSTGASFRQDGDPMAARPGTRLDGLDASTVFAPTTQPYLFSIRAQADAEGDLETKIEERIASLRESPVSTEELNRVRKDFLADLELDVETTEDAAHQMAFFEGIGAFAVLKHLPELVAAVTPEDIQRAASTWLRPEQRTIGWVHPGPMPTIPATRSAPPLQDRPTQAQPAEAARSAPRVKVLKNGIALIVRRIPRVPAGYLRVVLPGDDRTHGLSFQAGELAQAISQIRIETPAPPEETEDPELRLLQAMQDALGVVPATGASTPAAVIAIGDLDEDEALRLLETTFKGLPRNRPLPIQPLQVKQSELKIAMPGKAQSQIGYAVPADPAAALPWRMLLYLAAHDYEGRLGKELIARRGLLYYIGTAWHSDGRTAWLSLISGVNPDRLDETTPLFFGMLKAFQDHPPTEAEVEEARQYLIGRRLTAPMSNEEISAAYAREWIERGRLLTNEEWEREVRKVRREDLLRIVPAFLSGVSASLDVR